MSYPQRLRKRPPRDVNFRNLTLLPPQRSHAQELSPKRTHRHNGSGTSTGAPRPPRAPTPASASSLALTFSTSSGRPPDSPITPSDDLGQSLSMSLSLSLPLFPAPPQLQPSTATRVKAKQRMMMTRRASSSSGKEEESNNERQVEDGIGGGGDDHGIEALVGPFQPINLHASSSRRGRAPLGQPPPRGRAPIPRAWRTAAVKSTVILEQNEEKGNSLGRSRTGNQVGDAGAAARVTDWTLELGPGVPPAWKLLRAGSKALAHDSRPRQQRKSANSVVYDSNDDDCVHTVLVEGKQQPSLSRARARELKEGEERPSPAIGIAEKEIWNRILFPRRAEYPDWTLDLDLNFGARVILPPTLQRCYDVLIPPHLPSVC